MPTWDAQQYLRFAEERTRPCRELAARVAVSDPARVIDLGCGPGNSTQVLAERWPRAELTAIDSSPEMIEAARQAMPERQWRVEDVSHWAAHEMGRYDVVFSNAALQWVPEHATLFPCLMARVAPGGALAVQVPLNSDAPAHALARAMAASETWKPRFSGSPPREWHVDPVEFYYDVVAPHAERVDLWITEYQQVMPSAEAILEWYKGTGLRPYLDSLSEDLRNAFQAEYLRDLRTWYPTRPDGKVLFPFRRLFLVAYRGGRD